MDIVAPLVVYSIAFGRTVIGIVVRPYETYRRIVDRGSSGELYIIGLVLACYFVLASVVKVATFRPFILTREFILLYLAAAVSYGLTVGALWIAGMIFRVTVRLKALSLAWGYTLVPTVMWFLVTSLLYVILPPPRTTSVMGIIFSVLFVMFSVALLWWKIMLSYLTIRFVMKLDALRIVGVILIVLPIITLYSVLMYRWGIFKVPFI